jgi:hypothetical protein
MFMFRSNSWEAGMFPKSGRERLIAQIDREYPHQVVLRSVLDEDIEEDIIWFLDRRIGRWDMYADLRGETPIVRYCFDDQKDAAAFSLRFVAGTVRKVG